ncbi:hypothetical protein [Flavobacterium sp. FlaQc-48]|uniref:hypothetical protein n=1 Tax=Flavobacterium sp. FlaQc-48 TaxID=3374181 RepID=UPI0037580D3E
MKLKFFITLVFITSLTANAQFGKLLDKTIDKAVEKIQKKNTGKKNDTTTSETVEEVESGQNTGIFSGYEVMTSEEFGQKLKTKFKLF